MSAHLDHETWFLDQQRAMATSLRSLSLDSLHVLVVVRAKNLAKVRMGVSLPGNAENAPRVRDIFPYYDSICGLNFIHLVGGIIGCPQRALHFCLIIPNG